MRLIAAVLGLTLLAVSGTAFAADPVRVEITSVEEQPGRITADVSVITPDGRAAAGLRPESFRVLLNNTQVPVASVQGTQNRASSSVLLLVDVSGSMYGESITLSRKALEEFVRGLNGSDQVAIMAFATNVSLVQDFTSDKAALTQAIARLNPNGETALYDSVLEATRKMATAPEGRKLVLMLSDGQATVGVDKRQASLAAAAAGGVSFMAVGLGSNIDREYLAELASASNGRLVEAPTTAVLSRTYADLAAAIRSQFTLTIDVPESFDRTQPAKLSIYATVRADSGMAERALEPLAGATPPPFELKIEGMKAGQSLGESIALAPVPLPGSTYAKVEYAVDGNIVHSATAAALGYTLDPSQLTPGNHTLKVLATDERGRRGEIQFSFVALGPPPEPRSLPIMPIVALLAAVGVGGAGFLGLKRLLKPKPISYNYTGRLKPWAERTEAESATTPVEGWPEAPIALSAPPVPVEDRVLGRIVVIDEGAVKAGQLDALREYEIRSSPLTLGSGDHCDIQLHDADGRIAAEEARLWVQKGCLVYHKLSTLSAMATEGVTSGWLILESGEDIPLEAYRIGFQAEEPALDAEIEAMEREIAALNSAEAPQVAQEHGMRLQPVWNEPPPATLKVFSVDSTERDDRVVGL